jgi:hypothetical protein
MSVATGETLDGSAFGGVNTQNFACFGFGLRRLTDQRASDGASDDCRFHFASPKASTRHPSGSRRHQSAE